MTLSVKIGEATLYLGDCREILPRVGKVDAVVTDPPYGIGVGRMNRGKWVSSSLGRSEWDDKPADLSVLPDCPSIIWGGNYFQLPPSRGFLVWDKGAGFKGRDFAECEMAWCSFDTNARILSHDPLACGDYKGRQHPTQKPVRVMSWCLSFLPDAEVILDPFMGSGTTGVACAGLGRKFVGIEMDREYFEVACDRIEAAYAQGRLFA